SARQVLRRHPLDFEPIRQVDETTVHLVVVGLGAMGTSLALHAARIGHFANGVTHGSRLRITIADRNAAQKVELLRAHYPNIDLVCGLAGYEVDPTEATCSKALAELPQVSKTTRELVTYAICCEAGPSADDERNLRVGLELASATNNQPVQV